MFAKVFERRRTSMDGAIVRLVLAVLAVLLSAEQAHALPWDVDMFRQQSYKPGELARSPVKGTVPIGFRPFNMTYDQADKELKNPTPISYVSVWRGQRLWNSNCHPCHGHLADGKGPVGPKMGVPSLLADFYKGRSDGRIFATIKLGGANMPRYGYKFSDSDQWDIINYLRFLQGRDVPGFDRPK